MSSTTKTALIIVVTAIILIIGTALVVWKATNPSNAPAAKNNNPTASITSAQIPALPEPESLFLEPIGNAIGRITKKPFGLHVTPRNSPVTPEKFTGYHTGTDFEITQNEESIDIEIRAICEGTLLRKENVNGYGGVAIQSCRLDNEPITVLYGHLKLASVTQNPGDLLAAGGRIGVLSQGHSSETDGERKHLHLAIHKGDDIELRGYVQSESELSAWLNFQDYFK